MKTSELSEYIKNLPEEPGVYLFKSNSDFLYVGKAINIKERVRSYLQPRSKRIEKMIEASDSIDYQVTDNDSEALLLEANLVKKHEPTYNIRLKDGKSYPVLEITDHDYPQIMSTRDPNKNSRVYGPFTDLGTLDHVIKAMRDIYGIRGCSDQKYSDRERPCLDYQIGLCSAPCVNNITEKEYDKRLSMIESFLSGDSNEFKQVLENKMGKASNRNDFERAATLRDYITAVDELKGETNDRKTGITHVINTNEDYNVIGLIVVENATITRKHRYHLTEEAQNEEEALDAFISQYYASNPLPDTIIVPENLESTEISKWLHMEGVELKTGIDNKSIILLESAKEKAASSAVNRMNYLSQDIGIDIERVEAFDVSHSSGKNVVGSNIVFDSGKPYKSGYRRKKLPEKNDDYHNMYELIKWRALRAKEGRDERPDPDLILIDGGKNQLKAASEAMEEIGWSVPMIGIVKPEDKIVSFIREISVSEQSKELLREIRDEAHRFAVNYHKKMRDELETEIETIPGIGTKTAKRLLLYFDSVDDFENASKQDYKKVKGIGKKTANKLHEEFN